jgi:hypothetical protein
MLTNVDRAFLFLPVGLGANRTRTTLFLGRGRVGSMKVAKHLLMIIVLMIKRM